MRSKAIKTGERPTSVASLLGDPGPFRYRGGVRRLLGLEPAGGRMARPSGLVPPVGFRYLDRPLGDGPRVASPPAIRPSTPQLGGWQEPEEAAAARPAQAPADFEPIPAIEALPATTSPRAMERPVPDIATSEEPATASALPKPGTASAPSVTAAELVEPAGEQAVEARRPNPVREPVPTAAVAPGEPASLEPMPAATVPSPTVPAAAVSASTAPLASVPATPARSAAADERTESHTAAPPDDPRQPALAAEPAELPTDAQREAVWGMLERMGVHVPRPLEMPVQAAEQDLPPRTPVPALPASPEHHAPSTGADPGPQLAPLHQTAQIAEARVDRLRRATGELETAEESPPAPASEAPETPARRRPAGPVRQTVWVKRPPAPSRVPPAFWQRRRLNLSRLWPVR